MNMNKQESIKNKLNKLLALSERGVQGEAENARKLFENLCNEYGISIEDLLDKNKKEWHIFDVGKDNIYKDLFSQCYFSLLDENSMSYKSVSRSKIAVELTAMQYADLVTLFEWHKDNFRKDLDNIKQNILIAYCRKHHLYSHKDTDNDRELTDDERRRLFKIMFMQESLNDNQYQCYKLLEKECDK